MTFLKARTRLRGSGAAPPPPACPLPRSHWLRTTLAWDASEGYLVLIGRRSRLSSPGVETLHVVRRVAVVGVEGSVCSHLAIEAFILKGEKNLHGMAAEKLYNISEAGVGKLRSVDHMRPYKFVDLARRT